MRAVGHLTPRYVLDRIAVGWWQRSNPKAPWLTATAVGLLTDWLRREDTVFEWGSGKSTAWFAQHAGHVISVEHDPKWYAIVGAGMNGGPASVVERHLVETIEGVTDEPSANYVAVIDQVADAIDLVLVDGVHRNACAMRALPKLRPGGMLVLDNADWYLATGTRTPGSKQGPKPSSEAWDRFDRSVSRWRRIVTTNGVWDTVLWIKPPL